VTIMTLDQLVVGGGFAILFGLGAVLALLAPWRRSQASLCLKARPDEGCPSHCLRTCPLVTPDLEVRLPHARHAHAHGRS
jgi:hypothetical protein